MSTFKRPILYNGNEIYRKIIINSNSKGNDMTALANYAISEGFYAITFNQSGIRVYRPNIPTIETFKIKDTRLNELLYCIYKVISVFIYIYKTGRIITSLSIFKHLIMRHR